MSDLVVVHSATGLGERHAHRVAAVGSHGGLYPARLAARAGDRAVVFNDAGVGRYGARATVIG